MHPFHYTPTLSHISNLSNYTNTRVWFSCHMFVNTFAFDVSCMSNNLKKIPSWCHRCRGCLVRWCEWPRKCKQGQTPIHRSCCVIASSSQLMQTSAAAILSALQLKLTDSPQPTIALFPIKENKRWINLIVIKCIYGKQLPTLVFSSVRRQFGEEFLI